MKKIGITTTIPLEIALAAGLVPVDLNNLFITHPHPSSLVEAAEEAGLPRTLCAWVKGIYGLILKEKPVDAVIAVVQGDCSNTFALMENLVHDGIACLPFAFPHDRDPGALRREMEKMASLLGATWKEVLAKKEELAAPRAAAARIDRLTWEEDRVSGFENHLYLISCSDFEGDPPSFSEKMSHFLAEAEKREPMGHDLRLGYAGVPSVFSDLYPFLERRGARVVFNEMQRQFSMPGGEEDIVLQYLNYTYPYDVFSRIEDIRRAVSERRLDGLLHYVQAFCHHQMEDRILRDTLEVPVLTLEGDRPGAVDGRTALRIESFLDLLRERKGGCP